MKRDNRRICYRRISDFTVGSKGTDIQIPELNCQFLVAGNQLIFSKEDSQTGLEIQINGESMIPNRYTLFSGDRLEIENYIFVFLRDRIMIFGDDISRIQANLLEIAADTNVSEEFPNYKRSPRIIKRISDKTIQISQPKEMQEQKKGGLVALILPPIAMLCVTVAVSIIMKRGLFVLMSVAGTAVTLVTSVVKYITDKKDYKEEQKEREEVYREYLLRKQKEIYQAYQSEKEAYQYNYPNARELNTMIQLFDERIYERSVNDEDFLSVSLGKAYVPCQFKIQINTENIYKKEDELSKDAMTLVEDFSNIWKPVVVDLKKAHLGLVGEKDVIHEQLKLIIAQLTFFHSYHDLEIVTIYNEQYDEDFQWMRWYPHLRIHAINALGTINSERKRDQVLGSLNQILKERKLKVEESKKESMFLPHLLFVIDEPKLIMDHSIMEYLDKEGYSLGFSIIYTTNIRANLPENIGTIAMLENSTQATLLLEEKEEKNLPFVLQNTKGINLEWMARDLSVLEHMQGISSQIPKSITFFDMYHVEHPQEMEVENRWKRNNSSKSLAVPLGVRGEEDFVQLNLHEKAHGPHGLVAGTTGSGKSEIIQSYILSLAVNFHPYEVAFLLIDYKGGGMAGLFKNLPHLLGTITNLDGAQSMRAMASIKSELARRQRVFSSYEVNHINAYNKLFRNGTAKEPMPHLFIISDEFAELKKEQPDFMTELVSAARIGRSLGVHLILATQKPTGVVDDQIWTNSKFKLALMVQNEADSKEILKTPDAANITIPGRAYLQVGNNEIYELFQSAWSGASYTEEKEEKQVDDRVYLLNDLGQGELINRDLSEETDGNKITHTQLDAMVEYLSELYAKMDTVEVKRPWLPPLEEQIVSPQTAQAGQRCDLTVAIGMIDIPEEQKQEEYRLNFVKDGNLLYIASAGYGKTVFLTTVLLSLALKNSVEALNFYILDYGNSGLIALNRLHHTADYISLDDAERLYKFQRIIEEEINFRKKLLAKAMVQNFEVYNQVAEEPLKAIVVVIDNYDVVKELGYEAEEFFLRLSRDGGGLGIYMVVTATRSNAMKYSTYNNFKNKVAGYLFDESEANTIVGRSSYSPSEIKGRTLIKYNGQVSAMQIYVMTAFEKELEYNKGIEECIEGINALYPDRKAPRIPVLPETLEYAQFAQYIKGKTGIWLGLDKESVMPEGFVAGMTEPFVILGESAKGKTNLLKIILEQIIGSGAIYLFDSKSMELYSYKEREGISYLEEKQIEEFMLQIGSLSKERSKTIHQEIAKNPGKLPKQIVSELEPVYVMVDDWDNFVEITKLKAMMLAPVLAGAAEAGICFIISAHSGKMKGFDEITKFAKNTTRGVLLGSPGTTGMFNVASTKELPQLKDGLLFENGTYKRLRIPKYTE